MVSRRGSSIIDRYFESCIRVIMIIISIIDGYFVIADGVS